MPHTEPNAVPARPDRLLLVVATQGSVRQAMRAALEAQGYAVTEAADAAAAAKTLRFQVPDLVLLDPEMPRLDGFALCRKIVRGEAGEPTPVLLVLPDDCGSDCRRQAREAGAGDFVSAALEPVEVGWRVAAALERRQVSTQLRQHQAREEHLRLLSDQLRTILARDLRQPLTIVSGHLQGLCRRNAQRLPPKDLASLAKASSQLDFARETISALVDVDRLERQELPLHKRSCDLLRLVQFASDAAVPLLGGRHLEHRLVDQIPLIQADGDLLERVCLNLLANAIRSTPVDATIEVMVENLSDEVRVSVIDDGPALPPEAQVAAFAKVRQATASGHRSMGVGMGLAFCRLAVEAHRGRVGVTSVPGQGNRYWFSLPSGGPPLLSTQEC